MDPEAISKLLERTNNGVKAHVQNPDNYEARNEAQVATRQLLRELQTGDDAWWEWMSSTFVMNSVRILLGVGAFQSMPTDGSPISAVDLAKKCGTDVPLIVRPMRLAIAAGFATEVSQDVYKHNRLSLTTAHPGYRLFFEIIQDEFSTGTLGKLHEYYADHPRLEPTSALDSPYAWAQGMEGTDWIHVVARTPELIKKFSEGFSGGWDTLRHNMMGIFPFETLVEESAAAAAEDRVFMVDIGGNNGNALKEIIENYPDLQGKFVLQDLEPTIFHIPPGYLPDQVEAMVHNFWTPQPIKNASVYFLKRVLHDWPDKDCETILSHCAAAMGPNSRLIIAENLVPERVGEDNVVYFMDMIMFSFSGKERNAENWRRVLQNSGLELVKIYHGRVGDQCAIEARIKQENPSR